MKQVSFVRTSKEFSEKSSHSDTVICAACQYALEDSFLPECGYANPLSLDTLLVQHPVATFFVEVGSSEHVSIEENVFLGVATGDILTIDRALHPTPGRLVLAVRNGEYTLCRFIEHNGKMFLSEGDNRHIFEVDKENGIYVWGVVSALTRRF